MPGSLRAAFAAAAVVFALAGCEQRRSSSAAVGTLVFEPGAVYGTQNAAPNEDRAKTYLATQAEFLRSEAVRRSVADKVGLSAAEQKELASHLAVDRRGEALVLEVRVNLRDPSKASLLCNEVMAAYLDNLRRSDAQVDSERAQYLAMQEDDLRARDAGADADVVHRIRTELEANAQVRVLPARVLDACHPPEQ